MWGVGCGDWYGERERDRWRKMKRGGKDGIVIVKRSCEYGVGKTVIFREKEVI